MNMQNMKEKIRKKVIVILVLLMAITGCVLIGLISNSSKEVDYFMLVDDSQTDIVKDYKYYQNINKDLRMIILFTDRELPVVQSKDNEDYVRISFFKTKDSLGTIMIDYTSSIEADNVIIHGHSSIHNNYMFTPFKNKDFIKANQIFYIDFGSGAIEYQIISYYPINWDDDPDYSMLQPEFRNIDVLNEYIGEAIAKSTIDFRYEHENKIEQIITFITCDTRYENARFIVIAVPKKEGIE